MAKIIKDEKEEHDACAIHHTVKGTWSTLEYLSVVHNESGASMIKQLSLGSWPLLKGIDLAG